MKKISNLLIVGLGNIGSRYLKLIKFIRPEISIYTLRRSISEETFFNHLIDRNFIEIEDAINYGIDAAIISSPSTLHVMQALKFVENNIPILIEKPLSYKLDNCFELNDIATKKNSLILIGYVLRHTKVLKKFHELIKNKNQDSFSLIEITCSSYLPDWGGDKDYKEIVSGKKSLGGGVLLELSHELDYANWIFGPFKDIKSKIIFSGTLDIDVEDEVKIWAKNKNNVEININLDFHKNGRKRYCKVVTDQGFIKLDLISKEIIFKNHSQLNTNLFWEEYEEMYIHQIKHFFACIENNIEPLVTLNDGISTMRLINSILSSNVK